ncbi:MAG: 50S ribosomal protein L3 [Candidatus Omnitrophica bacterium]|nr:50S ribosomal protein L3 [Candidatus Omnitrophota bacterium]
MRRMGLLAKKLGMTQLFNEHGRVVAVTVLQAGPCTVTQVKVPAKDGYRSIQVGFGAIKPERLTKSLQGHLKKSGGVFRYLREFRTADDQAYDVGGQITVELFKEGELVDVTGRSVGKGFQGGVKRWHWKGAGMTHGAMGHRKPGSIGSTTTPGRVIKGHHLPGHMGNVQVTVQNLRIMKVDPPTNRLIIQGAVPGPENQLLFVKKSVKRPGAIVAAKGLQEVIVEEEEVKAAKKPAKKK